MSDAEREVCSNPPTSRGDLFPVPVNGGEDAELIGLIGRILEAAAADSIWGDSHRLPQ